MHDRVHRFRICVPGLSPWKLGRCWWPLEALKLCAWWRSIRFVCFDNIGSVGPGSVLWVFMFSWCNMAKILVRQFCVPWTWLLRNVELLSISKCDRPLYNMNSAIGECKSPFYIMKWATAKWNSSDHYVNLAIGECEFHSRLRSGPSRFFVPWFLQGKMVVGTLSLRFWAISFFRPLVFTRKNGRRSALARVLGNLVFPSPGFYKE